MHHGSLAAKYGGAMCQCGMGWLATSGMGTACDVLLCLRRNAHVTCMLLVVLAFVASVMYLLFAWGFWGFIDMV